jgi:predicted TIM-barrel fold metal-dependent hydrolase
MRSAKDFDIFDIHQHVGAVAGLLEVDGWYREGSALRADVDRRLKFMDSQGVDAALLMPGNGYPNSRGIEDTRKVNDYVVTYRDMAPERFPAITGTVNPLEGKEALYEIERCMEKLGMNGMVWHHRFLGTVLDHSMMHPFLKQLTAYKLPAFVHIIADSKLESPWRLERLADKHPDLTFVALDGFSSPDQSQWMPYLASKHPNIVFDTGVLMSVGHSIKNFLNTVGPERLLLGTDYYSDPELFNVAFPILELLASDIDDKSLRMIFGGNARRLLGLKQPQPALEGR